MKLIRLMSNNNGVFTNSFGNEMTLEPNSSMALLNLTFKTNLGVLIDLPEDRAVSFEGFLEDGITPNPADNIVNLPAKLFKVADIQQFNDYIQYYLNSSIPFDRDYTTGVKFPWTTGAFRITQNSKGFNSIEYRYAPFVNPLYDSSGAGATGPLPLKSMTTDATQIKVTPAGSVDGQRTEITMADGVINTTNTKNNIVALEGRRLNDGTAFYCCRIADYNDNGNAGVNDNGFSIGLSKGVPVEQGVDIPANKRNYEINFNRDTESYKFINNGIDGTLLTPTPPLLPVLVIRGIGEKQQEHDIIGFEVEGGQVSSCVYQIKEEVYLNLVEGNDWTRAPSPETEVFDTTNLGDIATYRRTQVAAPTYEQWWEADGAANWNYYNTGPPVAGDVPSGTATIDAGTGVITIGGTTFTPNAVPKLATTPTRTVLATSTLLPGEELYPYMYINGSSVNVTVNMLNYSIDPWLVDGLSNTDTNKDWDITGTRDSGLNNDYLYLVKTIGHTSEMNTIIPVIGGDDRFGVEKAELSIQMPAEVWKVLGRIGANGDGDFRSEEQKISSLTNYQISWDMQILPAIYDSDNYMVVSDSLALDSYDASRVLYDKNIDVNQPSLLDKIEKSGRRKNILMTIPENNNEDGLVEFETNTPIFIDLNNAVKINPRNLNFRVLDKNFDKIQQDESESAIMTILIKKPGE